MFLGLLWSLMCIICSLLNFSSDFWFVCQAEPIFSLFGFAWSGLVLLLVYDLQIEEGDKWITRPIFPKLNIWSRVAQWKRAGPITQRSVDRNYALLIYIFCFFVRFFFLQNNKQEVYNLIAQRKSLTFKKNCSSLSRSLIPKRPHYGLD